MDDRKRTLAAVTIIVAFLVLVAVVVGVLVTGNKVVSPVPDENAIKIIFISPTPQISPSPATVTPSPTTQP